MKQLLLALFVFLVFVQKTTAQSITFQDSTFTEPVTIADITHLEFENCHFTGITADAALTLTNVFYVKISNCTFENITGNAVVVKGSDYFYLDSSQLYNISGAGVAIRQVRIANFTNCQLSNISGRAFHFSNAHTIDISSSQLSDVGNGITCFGSGKVDTLRVHDTSIRRVNGLPGEPESGDGIRIANTGIVYINLCTVDSCAAAGIFIGQGNTDSTAVDSILIWNNTISHTNFDGLFGEGNARHAYIHDNEISYAGFLGGQPDVREKCIRWQGPDFRIEDNQIHHAVDAACGQIYCGAGISIGNYGLVARNRVYNCHGNGIEYSNGQDAAQQDLRIFNNIVYDVSGNPVLMEGSDSLNSELGAIIIRNNTLLGIFHGGLDTTSKAPLVVCCNASHVTAQGNILLYQSISDTSKYIHTYDGGMLTENLNLKATSGTGFVDYLGRDFHLVATALAIDVLPPGFGEPNDDFDHESRDQKHDAGADEFPAAAPNFCGCVNCPSPMPDNFMGNFFYYVSNVTNNDLASSTQGVCGVRVNFDHEYLGDLTMRLFSPAGQSVTLVGPTGFFGPTDGAYWNITFAPCATAVFPDNGFSETWSNFQSWLIGGSYSGSYYPEEGCLEEFNTGSVKGVWRLEINDNQAVDQGFLYDFEIIFCDTAGITCLPCVAPPTAGFSVTTDDWTVLLQNTSTDADSYQVYFGDGSFFSGTTIPNAHTYADTGTYLLRLLATNLCGLDTLEQTIHIMGALPNASASATPSSGCASLSVQAVVSAAEYVDNWHWFFPGAIPAESLEMEPTVVYNEPGIYPAILIVTNTVGSDTIFYPNFVEVNLGLLAPGFTVQVEGDTIIATNTTQNFIEYYWLLDGTAQGNGNAQQQVYVVDSAGTYVVTLYVANNCDTAFIVQSVPVILSSAENTENKISELLLLPNPNNGSCHLEMVSPENLLADIVILNTTGQNVFTQKIDITAGKSTRPDLDVSHLPSGFYLLRLQTAAGSKTIPFTLQH